ncbi:MAG TPA: acyltransferase [Trebonia sp.]|jgi:acetyltransferase-like isoleucine patch superfamily enzyme|nr:acyltransferase [Trebonia sp.]
MALKNVLRVSVLRSLYLSIRSGGQFIVLRGTRIGLGPGARIEVPRGCRVFVGEHIGGGTASVDLRRNAVLSFHGSGRVSIARGARLLVLDDARLEIWNGTTINYNATVTCFKHISIAENAGISWNVNILDGNGHELVVDGVPRPPTQPTRIGAGTWIGTGATILAARVGDGALVAAGSVVIADVPDRAAVAGVPARVIGKGVSWHADKNI